jgi:hypothetical protein
MSAMRVRRFFPFLLVLLLGLPVTTLAQTVRGHSGSVHVGGSSGHVHSGGSVHTHVGFGVGFGYPYYGYGYYGYPGYYGYYGAPYYAPYYGGYYGPPAYVDRGPGSDVAFLDLDVSPERASVYLDGDYVGEADNFDGYPRYLSVEPGSHTVRFEAPGRVPVTRKVKVPRGAVVRFDFALQKGTGTGAGQNDREIVIPEAPGAYDESNSNNHGGNGNHGGKNGGGSYATDPGQGTGAVQSARMQGEHDAPDSGPGLLKLNVTPADASVYIDGQFMGTGSTISRLHGSLRLGSGSHTIEVARPGFRTYTRQVTLNGEPLPVDINLQRN